jgi:hypothetical protein
MASTVVRGNGSPPDPAGAYLGVAEAISTASEWERTMVFGLVAGRPMHMAASFPGRSVLHTCSDSICLVNNSVAKSYKRTITPRVNATSPRSPGAVERNEIYLALARASILQQPAMAR